MNNNRIKSRIFALMNAFYKSNVMCLFAMNKEVHNKNKFVNIKPS